MNSGSITNKKTVSAPFERVKMIMQCIDNEIMMIAPEPRASKIVIDVMDSIQERFDSSQIFLILQLNRSQSCFNSNDEFRNP